MAFKASGLEDIIEPLRIHLGDTGPTYSYTDELLHGALRSSVNALMNRWYRKYFVDNDGVVQRNPTASYDFSNPPVIQRQDERAIVLQASIMIKGGQKFSNVDNAISWKDDEISYSAIEAAKQRSSTLADDQSELDIILPARKKLARPVSERLYGWNTP